mmetsp:Transcript_21282/g.50005  ORF Transcript_21282/g.50005 Transcript_21282/m.50005 type:complete len:91 (+) Transcript_21282:1399-1671(+)
MLCDSGMRDGDHMPVTQTTPEIERRELMEGKTMTIIPLRAEWQAQTTDVTQKVVASPCLAWDRSMMSTVARCHDAPPGYRRHHRRPRFDS